MTFSAEAVKRSTVQSVGWLESTQFSLRAPPPLSCGSNFTSLILKFDLQKVINQRPNQTQGSEESHLGSFGLLGRLWHTTIFTHRASLAKHLGGEE